MLIEFMKSPESSLQRQERRQLENLISGKVEELTALQETIDQKEQEVLSAQKSLRELNARIVKRREVRP